ncbi:PRA1 family protein 1, partial [Lecanoromycetidae sp. Uapishka_2]
MSRINIPLEALTSRLNLGSRFEGVRSQSLGTRFANLKPISEFLDLKRLSKPANFGEVQSRVNWNLSYFSSNYFAVAVMLTIYSLLTNLALLFDMIFIGVGLFAIKKLDGRDLELGFTRARPGKRRGGLNKQAQYEEDIRFEEIDSDEDDGLGVALDEEMVGDDLHYTGTDMGRRSRRRHDYDFSGSSRSSEDDDRASDDGAGRTMQIALRDKEELLLQKALQRIRRAQLLGKKNVKLTQPELDALERKRRKDQAMKDQTHRRSSASNLKGSDMRRSSGQSGRPPEDKKSGKRSRKGYFSAYDDDSSSSSRRVTPPGILVPGHSGAPAFSPLGHYPPTIAPQRISSRAGSRSTSSHSLAQASPPLPRTDKHRYSAGPEPSPAPRSPLSSRRLPDDPHWEPRSRSSSTASAPYPSDPYHFQINSPPLPQLPAQYSQSRRIVSNPQPDVRYPRIRGEPQARSSEPSLLRRENSGQATPSINGSEDDTDSGDDDDGAGVQVDVMPYGQGYGINMRAEYSARERLRRGQR